MTVLLLFSRFIIFICEVFVTNAFPVFSLLATFRVSSRPSGANLEALRPGPSASDLDPYFAWSVCRNSNLKFYRPRMPRLLKLRGTWKQGGSNTYQDRIGPRNKWPIHQSSRSIGSTSTRVQSPMTFHGICTPEQLKHKVIKDTVGFLGPWHIPHSWWMWAH